MTDQIIQLLLRLNVAASAGILLVLVLRRPLRGGFGPLPAYALWLAVPLCAAASLLPAPPSVERLEPFMAFTWLAATRGVQPITQAPSEVAGLLVAIWLAGAAVTAFMFAVRQARFVRFLGRLAPLSPGSAVLRSQHLGSSPVVLGSLRPRIVVPADFEVRFDEQARRLILAHERVHLARGDAAVNGVAALLQCMAWFNPLIHLAAGRLRADQEIACDASVIGRHPHARRAYAEALLDTVLIQGAVPFGCHWPSPAKGALKERLLILSAAPANPLRRTVGMGLAAGLGLACASTVWAASAPSRLIKNPIWIARPSMENAIQAYPVQAAAERISGKAVIYCRVTRTGRLDQCAPRMEAPEGAGFGEAATKIGSYFQMAARTRDGEPTAGGRVRIPVRFVIPAP